MKVDFFIAGVQKGGTTALDSILRGHPALQMAAKKEVHYFDNESLDWPAGDSSFLHEHFDWTQDRVVRGEATPIYTYWPNALERMARYNPDAKIIIGLRHPTFRAYSHWKMEVSRGAETLSFSEAIRSGRGRVTDAPGEVHRTHSYVERGFYGWQLDRIANLFDRQHIHFFRTDELWLDPIRVVADIEKFLGVPAYLTPQTRYIVPVESRIADAISRDDRTYLDGLFQTEIYCLGERTGLNCGGWLDENFQEPMFALR